MRIELKLSKKILFLKVKLFSKYIGLDTVTEALIGYFMVKIY
jgi:hypothetical protein